MPQLRNIIRATAIVFLLAPGISASIIVNDGSIETLVGVGPSGPYDVDSVSGVWNGTSSFMLSECVSHISLSTNGDSATTVFDFQRSGDYYDQAVGRTAITFTSVMDQPFVLSGGIANFTGHTICEALLYDNTTGGYLFYTAQHNYSPDPHTVELGLGGGNVYGGTQGSLFGTLIAGHSYYWTVSALTSSRDNVDDGATGIGSFSLRVGDAPPIEAVPEPASVAVWSCLGLIAIGGAWWEKRRSR
ncbi:MAG: hypothetical protein SGJ19_08135 [Planctomycetia bacterium]|nr:hypothetical protein [Planctomycetia bacterium]